MWIDGFLKNNLDIVKDKAIPNKWDCLAIIFGIEGAGKSTIASQCAHYLDPNFNIENVVFTPEQFETAIDECKPESSIVWDEAITGANVAMYASKISISIISKLTQIRKKKLKIFLCFPYMFMLNKYFLSRCLFSIYVYAKNFDDRGYYKFYNNKKSQILYFLMKDRYPYYPDMAFSKIFPGFHGRFSKEFMVNEDVYDEKKETSRVQDSDDKTDKMREIAKNLRETGMTYREIGKIMGFSENWATKLCKT
jgi:hypothetical protein